MVQLKVNGTNIIKKEGGNVESESKLMQTQQIGGSRLTSCTSVMLLSKERHETNGTNNGDSTTGTNNTKDSYHRNKNGKCGIILSIYHLLSTFTAKKLLIIILFI